MSNFTISIEIKAPDIVEALTNLAAAITINKVSGVTPYQVEAPKVDVPKNISADTSKKEPKVTEPTEPTVEKGGTEDPTVTVEEIRAKVKEKAKVDKTAVKALLKEFDASSVTALAKEHYDKFYVKLGEL